MNGLPRWALGVIPLLVAATAIAIFIALGGPGLGERRGPDVEEVAVERTVLKPGKIELTVRNDGPDPIKIAQVSVNDTFSNFVGVEQPLDRLAEERLTIDYHWVEGENYEISLLTSTGATFLHEITAAVDTPQTDTGFYGLMALLGIYVGVIPVAMGMLWLPWVARVRKSVLAFLMALTAGLLAFLGIEATLEGLDIAGAGPQSLGGASLVFLGMAAAYLSLGAIGSWLEARQKSSGTSYSTGRYTALLVAVGIGLHNFGEGLAIGSAYTSGALALGAFLVVGFAVHNTTEGLAIVAPLGREQKKPGIGSLMTLGLIAGAPAILGTWIGAAAFNPSAAALLFGMGAGAALQVVVTLLPAVKDGSEKILNPVSAGGILAGMGAMYLTGLLIGM